MDAGHREQTSRAKLPACTGPASPEWIAGRIQTLLSHYYQPDNPADVTMAALTDWMKALRDCSEAAIEHACGSYLRDQPRRRPTPGDIRARATSFREERARKMGDLAEFWASVVNRGGYVPPNAISSEVKMQMISRKLVDPDTLRALTRLTGGRG